MSDEPTRRRILQAPALAVGVGALALGLARSASAAADEVPVPRYLLDRAAELGADVLFGVPGATCDPLFHAAAEAGTRVVVPSSDLGAAYAADGFARTKGLALVSVTYGVGALGMLPVIAGAYAERSPIVVVNGGPTADDLTLQEDHGTLFSHSSGGADVDLRLFREVTAHAVRIERASEVPGAVDQALAVALREQRPVYIEIPKNLWWARCAAPAGPIVVTEAAGEAPAVAGELLAWLQAGERPLVMAGVGLRRHPEGLQDLAQALVDRAGLPWVSTFLGKSVLDEQRPGFAGVYAGARSVPAVRALVDGADRVLALGCVFGRQYRTLASKGGARLARIGFGEARIGDGPVRAAGTGAVLRALVDGVPQGAFPEARVGVALEGKGFEARRASVVERPAPAAVERERGIGYDEVMSQVSKSCSDGVVVLSDTSLSMYPAAELDVRGRDGFVCDAVWAAIGWSVGAAVGVALGQGRRPLVICGDGGFQMTSEALSAMARYRLPAVVLVLDNGVYGIEQWLLDPTWHRDGTRPPRDYLALGAWRYPELGQAMGVRGVAVADGAALATALTEALAYDGPTLIAVRVRPHDLPMELRA